MSDVMFNVFSELTSGGFRELSCVTSYYLILSYILFDFMPDVISEFMFNGTSNVDFMSYIMNLETHVKFDVSIVAIFPIWHHKICLWTSIANAKIP